ncbi:hypothetical protein BGW80DRAFT_1249064 [Lactifluus volemus]|nr:hypothetical protein BGW80DRAFT_1249064 [Lactifluus volemus]
MSLALARQSGPFHSLARVKLVATQFSINTTTTDFKRRFYDSGFDPLPAVKPLQTATISALTSLSDLEPDEPDESQNEDVEDHITVIEELRKQARHHDLEMFEARKLAKDARRKQDYQAERKYNKTAPHENTKEI